MHPKLSLIVPGIRNENWPGICEMIKSSCKKYTYEIVFSSPNPNHPSLIGMEGVKFIEDSGSPSRSLQHASTFAEGEYIAIMSDDVIVLEDSLDMCIDMLERQENNPQLDIVALRYTEGPDFKANPNDFPPQYWNAKYHGDLRIEGIEDDWKICLMFLMRTERFRYLGGIDCRFEHFNCNLHDLAFRAQRDGSKILISECFVTAHDWDPDRNRFNSPILQAFYENDRPLFESIYTSKYTAQSRDIRISYDNWKDQPAVWPRRGK